MQRRHLHPLPSLRAPSQGPRTALIMRPHTSCPRTTHRLPQGQGHIDPAQDSSQEAIFFLLEVLLPHCPRPLPLQLPGEGRKSPEKARAGHLCSLLTQLIQGRAMKPRDRLRSTQQRGRKGPRELTDVVVTAIDGTNRPAPRFLRQRVSRKSGFQTLGSPC